MKNRYFYSSLLFIIVLFGLSVSAWLKEPTDMSDSERRPLAKFPEFTAESVLKGDFTADFEDYATDQFPLRDTFRTLKAIAKFYLFAQKDNNSIYISDGYAAKIENKLNDASLNNAGTKINYLYENFVKGKTDKVYFSIVPDKSMTLSKKGSYPAIDHTLLADIMKEKLSFAEYIDVYPLLDYTDYYKTDTHWRQEKIVDVADAILSALGKESTSEYERVEADKDFYGVYYGQSSLPLPPERITYLTNDVIENALVYNYEKTDGILENISPESVYNLEKLDSKDPYEIFLSGASYLMRIKNPENESGEKLIVFRDSFTSSLAPLMIESYSEIILVDTRYIASFILSSLLSPEEFENADVLFLYSAMFLNDSFLMR